MMKNRRWIISIITLCFLLTVIISLNIPLVRSALRIFEHKINRPINDIKNNYRNLFYTNTSNDLIEALPIVKIEISRKR